MRVDEVIWAPNAVTLSELDPVLRAAAARFATSTLSVLDLGAAWRRHDREDRGIWGRLQDR